MKIDLAVDKKKEQKSIYKIKNEKEELHVGPEENKRTMRRQFL